MNYCIIQQNLNRGGDALFKLTHLSSIHHCDILLLQESPLDINTLLNKLFPFNNIRFLHTTNLNASIIILNEKINFTHLSSHSCDTVVSVKIICDHTFVLSSVYLPTSGSLINQISFLETISSGYSNIPLILSGDFNCRHHTWDVIDNLRGSKLFEFASIHNLRITHSDLPTFVHHDKSRRSNIDLTLSNNLGSSILYNWISFNTDEFSDHSPQMFHINSVLSPSTTFLPNTFIYKEKYTDWSTYASLLNSSTLMPHACSTFTTIDDADRFICSLIENFVSAIDEAALNCMHLINKSPTKPSRPYPCPWWDKDIAILSSDAKRLKNRACKAKNLIIKQIFKDKFNCVKAKLSALIKAKFDNYWTLLMNECDKSFASDWNFAFKFIKKNLKPTSSKQQISILEGDLSEVKHKAKNLLEQFFPPFVDQSYPKSELRSFHIPSIDHSILTNIINNSRSNSSPGPDGITNNMIKHIPSNFLVHLHSIYSMCLSHGIFPSCWKISAIKVLPKPNKLDYNDPASYRPIALTSNFSKILEKIIHFNLQKHLRDNHIISDSQHGFTRGKSTSSALKSILTLCESKKTHKVAIVSFDFKAAFDNVPHSLIVSNLIRYGVPDYLTAIILSYLSDRQLFININNEKVWHSGSHKGCPQGGVLSPTLWSLVMNSLLEKFKSYSIDCIAYADDLSVICCGRDDYTLSKHIELAHSLISEWSSTNKIPLNLDKSNVLPLFNSMLTIHRKVANLNVVDRTTILGLIFTRDLSFILHVTEKLKSTAKYNELLKNYFGSFTTMNAKTKCTIYNGFAKSTLLYACEVWGNRLDQSTTRQLETSDNKSLRLCIGGFGSTPKYDLYTLTNTPPINHIIQSRVTFFNATFFDPANALVYKVACRNQINEILPGYMNQCKIGVKTAISNKNFSISLLNQATTTLLTEHGPTRGYLRFRELLTSPDCLLCQVSETYDHILLHCPNFLYFRTKYNLPNSHSEIINHLLDNNTFLPFSNDLLAYLRLNRN